MISNTTSQVSYTGNGSTVTAYPVTFPLVSASHLVAEVIDDAGDTTVLESSDFTFTPTTSGGRITGGSVTTSPAIPSSSTLILRRETPAVQSLDLEDGARLRAESLENAFDKLTMLAQELRRELAEVEELVETLAEEGIGGGGGVQLGETSTTAYRGDRGKIAYDHSQATGNPHNTTAGDVGACADDDARLSDARTPTAHKTSHATGGGDALSPADIGAATAAQGAKADTAVQPGTTPTLTGVSSVGSLPLNPGGGGSVDVGGNTSGNQTRLNAGIFTLGGGELGWALLWNFIAPYAADMHPDTVLRWAGSGQAGSTPDIGVSRAGDGLLKIFTGGSGGGLRDVLLRNAIFTPSSSLTPANNGELVFEATSNTVVTVKLKGSDGTVRTGTISLS